MAFRVSRAAEADLRQIARYTEREWGVAQRRRYLSGLNDEFEALSLNPHIAPERGDFDPPVRIRRYERHLIIYVMREADVLIVRVLHQSMDVPSRLAQK
jgi:toxin ParE1/3/4